MAFENETARQQLGQDSDFYSLKVYFFELFVPRSISGPMGEVSYVFPLALNPRDYSMDEPFTVEATPTQGGGLFVEENGIVQRKIRLAGHTGFKPRRLDASTLKLLGDSQVAETKSYSRNLLPQALVALSGQRHFQYLQDALFRTYADLKRNSATAAETKMVFHNQKDDEHWRVVPEHFGLKRSSRNRVLYEYDIQLLVVGPEVTSVFEVSEDKDWMDAVKDAQRYVQSGLQKISGAFNDLTALSAELGTLVRNFAVIIDNASTVIDAASNFVSGATDLIQTPLVILNSTIGLIESALSARYNVETSGAVVRALPDVVNEKFREMQDGMERLLAHPAAFETPSEREMRTLREKQELRSSLSDDALEEARGTPPPTTLSAVESLGSAVTQGDVIASDSELGVGYRLRDYTSTIEVRVEQGDTLASLAGKYLGDARRWQDIAVVNGLRPPFVDDLASAPLDRTDERVLSGALGIGDGVLIPTFQPPPEAQAELPILGVRREAPASEHFLGRDLALVQTPGSRTGAPQYDLAVDDTGLDARTVAGVDNVKQALRTRLRTPRGTYVLYKNMGIRRVIGIGASAVGADVAKFRVLEALKQDPRVQAVLRVRVEAGTSDVFEADVDVGLRGFAQTTNVKAPV